MTITITTTESGKWNAELSCETVDVSGKKYYTTLDNEQADNLEGLISNSGAFFDQLNKERLCAGKQQ